MKQRKISSEKKNVLSSFRRQTLVIREKFKENSFICRSKKKKIVVGIKSNFKY